MKIVPLYFDEKSLKFRNARGEVSRNTVRRALERARNESKARLGKLATDLHDGKINLPQFAISARDEIKALHALHGGIASGGKARLSPSLLGKVGSQTKAQYAYLNNLVRQVARGEQAPGAGLTNRIKLYADAAHATHSELERKLYVSSGYTEARRVLNSRESCDGCLDEANAGWQDIDDVAEIGSQDCLARCLCEIIYRKADVADG